MLHRTLTLYRNPFTFYLKLELIIITPVKGGYVLVVLVCLSVRQQDYLQSNEQICMNLLPEV